MKYTLMKPGPNGWTKWSTVDPKSHLIACCDCGLAHKLQVRAYKGKIQHRVQRNDRSTAALRRNRKFPCKVRNV